MNKFLFSGLLILSTSFVFADGHSSAEKEVLKTLATYFEAMQVIGKQLLLTKVNQEPMEPIQMAVSISL